MDNVTISYEIAADGLAPNNCKASANYKGQTLVAYGTSWATAKENLLARVAQLKGIGDAPEDETLDMDPAVATEKAAK